MRFPAEVPHYSPETEPKIGSKPYVNALHFFAIRAPCAWFLGTGCTNLLLQKFREVFSIARQITSEGWMDEITVWRSAHSLIQVHGQKAAMEAAMMADKMRAEKDATGYQLWQRIVAAIREMEERAASVRDMERRNDG
jgi:hypothetical protein